VDALAASTQFERAGIRRAISALLASAEVIPLDAHILRLAAHAEGDYELSGQDSIVLASVLSHLEAARPGESCFLNRNARDFDDPNIRGTLEDLGCKFFARFGLALEYILTRIQ